MKYKIYNTFGDYFKDQESTVVFILEIYKYYPDQNIFRMTTPKFALVVYRDENRELRQVPLLESKFSRLKRYDGGLYIIKWSHPFFTSNLYLLPCNRNWFCSIYNGNQYFFIIHDVLDFSKTKEKMILGKKTDLTDKSIRIDVNYKKNWKDQIKNYFNRHPTIKSEKKIQPDIKRFECRVNKKRQVPSHRFRIYNHTCTCVNCEEQVFRDGLCRKHYELERTTK